MVTIKVYSDAWCVCPHPFPFPLVHKGEERKASQPTLVNTKITFMQKCCNRNIAF